MGLNRSQNFLLSAPKIGIEDIGENRLGCVLQVSSAWLVWVGVGFMGLRCPNHQVSEGYFDGLAILAGMLGSAGFGVNAGELEEELDFGGETQFGAFGEASNDFRDFIADP